MCVRVSVRAFEPKISGWAEPLHQAAVGSLSSTRDMNREQVCTGQHFGDGIPWNFVPFGCIPMDPNSSLCCLLQNTDRWPSSRIDRAGGGRAGSHSQAAGAAPAVRARRNGRRGSRRRFPGSREGRVRSERFPALNPELGCPPEAGGTDRRRWAAAVAAAPTTRSGASTRRSVTCKGKPVFPPSTGKAFFPASIWLLRNETHWIRL